MRFFGGQIHPAPDLVPFRLWLRGLQKLLDTFNCNERRLLAGGDQLVGTAHFIPTNVTDLWRYHQVCVTPLRGSSRPLNHCQSLQKDAKDRLWRAKEFGTLAVDVDGDNDIGPKRTSHSGRNVCDQSTATYLAPFF